MTDEPVGSILEAELETGALLEQTLERQRKALVARDLDRITELTGILEEQMEHFNLLVQARTEALAEEMPLSDRDAELLRRIRQTEARVLRLSELNQDLIADRLAWVSAMLSTIGLTGAAGYGVDAGAGQISRSA
jgi:hypothetical protein